MKKQLAFLGVVIVMALQARAGNKFKYYFNHPVNNAVSTGENAVYLGGCLADTLVAYINRSHYTLDIAVYDYVQGSFANIATAVNNAYTRGVQVRWIFDGSSSNTGLGALNPAIHTLGSPTTGSYGIMHCKFMVIDGNSANPNDAIVWTGSTNWTSSQFNTDYNNVVIIQDSALAHAYLGEFNHMWGSTGLAPNLSLSKFGPYKSDLGRHGFTIEGKHVELYFSPSDGTNSKIQAAINTANTDLYFGMYAFTDNTDASLIMTKYTSGVYVAGIDDNFSHSYTPYGMFSSGLGSNFKEYTGTGIYHNKFMIVDPSDKCSDPLVFTGSHNWSVSADTRNDENSLIIHDDTAANIYYQSFNANFTAIGGTLATQHGCELGESRPAVQNIAASVYPNPTNGQCTLSFSLTAPEDVTIEVVSMTGRVEFKRNLAQLAAGDYIINIAVQSNGVYMVKIVTGAGSITKRLVVNGL